LTFGSSYVHRAACICAVGALVACGSATDHRHSLTESKRCLHENGYDPAEEHFLPTVAALTTTIRAGEAVIMFFASDASEAKGRVDRQMLPSDVDREQHGNAVIAWAGYVPGNLKDRFRDCLR
jgi:hypothetical protein